MERTFFVISDLHLGGKPGFQICSDEGQQRLTQFIRWAKEQRTSERDVHLVIAGDIVDFLAEAESKAFTADDHLASQKLENIFKNFADVWESLREFVTSGSALTMMLGNHDIELSLPGPHRLLREKLGQGRVDFVCDNQAFVEGAVLIEHGNRYDEWNVVPHDELRQIRSALSRQEPPPALPEIPGSEMVCRVMNELKSQYQFIDLLKPETQAALPLLAVLEPIALQKLATVVQLARKARRTRFDAHGSPIDRNKIAATAASQDARTEQLLKAAQKLAGVPTEAAQIGAFQTMQAFRYLWQAATAQADRDKQTDRLYRALKLFAAEQYLAFDLEQEDEIYLKPARTMAARGFRAIVFGHTHLVKKVALPNNAVYLNSGTWADIIRLPDSLFEDDEATAKTELATFADDLTTNNLVNWRHPVASYVRIDTEDNQITDSAVWHFASAESPAAPPSSNRKG